MVKHQIQLDGVFSALSDPTRRAIVSQLAQGPLTVGELAAPFDMSLAAVSKHLQVLERAGLVARTRCGRQVECELQVERLKLAADWLVDYRRFWNERLTALEKTIRQRRRRIS